MPLDIVDGVNLKTEPDGQVVAQVVAEPSLIAPHVPSVKTQTLQNKAFPVIDRHGPSVGIPQVGDEGHQEQKPLYVRDFGNTKRILYTFSETFSESQQRKFYVPRRRARKQG